MVNNRKKIKKKKYITILCSAILCISHIIQNGSWSEMFMAWELFFSSYKYKYFSWFFSSSLLLTLHFVIEALSIIVPMLIAVAFFTLAERKILAAIQRRKGANVVGTFGLLQPLSDGFKLLVKESLYPTSIHSFLFITAPVVFMLVGLSSFAIIAINERAHLVGMNIGILFLLAISSISVYGLILAGWSSNSKYSFLGGLRSTAQMVSYETTMTFCVSIICGACQTFEIQEIVDFQRDIWLFIPFFPLLILFLISILAETNRHPFDLPEAESELVSGYNVEYGAIIFALFSLGEYLSMLAMSSLTVTLFFGGWLSPFECLNFIPGSLWFAIKVSACILYFIWTRGTLPRYRYDQLMALGWKYYLPTVLGFFLLTMAIIFTGDNSAS